MSRERVCVCVFVRARACVRACACVGSSYISVSTHFYLRSSTFPLLLSSSAFLSIFPNHHSLASLIVGLNTRMDKVVDIKLDG